MAEKRNKPQHPSDLLIELGQLGKWVTRETVVCIVCKLCPPIITDILAIVENSGRKKNRSYSQEDGL